MDLSIVILFSDNDYKRLPKLIQSIKDNIRIKGKYEIIVSDNRDKFKNENLGIPEDIIISDNLKNFVMSLNFHFFPFCSRIRTTVLILEQ